MDRIRYYADISIRRACGFGFLAVITGMVGASSQLVLSFKIGATSLTLMSIILLLKAMQAPVRSYKRTEVWILLDHRHDLPEKRAQEVFGAILRERYMWHATAAAGVAAIFWVLTFSIHLFWPPPAI